MQSFSLNAAARKKFQASRLPSLTKSVSWPCCRIGERRSVITPKRVFLAVLCSCLFFCAAGSIFLPHLGIQTDEALFIAGVYQTSAAFYKIHIRHQFIPLMLSSYNGTLKSLLYSGLFQIVTPSAASTRIPVILIGAATVWMFSILLRRISGPWAAIAGAMLLATDTIFLLTDTFDWGPVALQHLLLVSGMLVLYCYYETRRLLYLGLGFFLFGLAMWDKAVFIWSLAGLAVASAIVFPRAVVRLARPKALCVAVLGFLLGALPLASFNWKTKGETLRSNAAWSAGDIGGKLAMTKGTLQGAFLFSYMVREDDATESPAPPRGWLQNASERISAFFDHPRRNYILVGMGAAILLVPLLRRARTPAPRTILFCAMFLLITWLAMALNRNTGGSVHHIVLLWPFPHMVIAVAFGEAAQKFGTAGKTAMAVMLLLLVSSNLLVTNEYYRMLRRNGGSAIWSDAVYPLSGYLRGVPAMQVMPIDWGVFDSLRLLNAGKLPLRVGMDPLGKSVLDAHDRDTVREWLDTPGTVFVSHTRENEVFSGVGARLDEVASAAGWHKQLLDVLSDTRARPIFEVFRYTRP
jgi:4-amino-4-deoxy-L-arabinose transferase-like glycosyltransferase